MKLAGKVAVVTGASKGIGAGIARALAGEGAAVGALSLVKKDLDPWTLYAGIPARRIKARNRAEIQRLEGEFRMTHHNTSHTTS